LILLNKPSEKADLAINRLKEAGVRNVIHNDSSGGQKWCRAKSGAKKITTSLNIFSLQWKIFTNMARISTCWYLVKIIIALGV
jgi:hypothetical protein